MTPEPRPATGGGPLPIEQLAEFVPGALFRFRVLSDGRRVLDHMTRGCFDIWELDAAAVEHDMASLWAMVYPEDLPPMWRSIAECAAQLRDWNWQWRIKTPSGRTKWLHGVGRPMRDGDGTLVWHVFVLDQTDNRQAQENLRVSEARFRRLLDAIPNVAVQGYDEHLICRYWNRASEQLYGWRSEEAVGRNLLDLIIPEGMRADVVAATQHMMATGEAIPSGELVLCHRNGNPVPVYSGHVLLQRQGERPEFFCIDYDLRERQLAEDTRRLLENQLRESQKMEALGTLAGGVAHDFNNIVAAILGNVELALDDVPAESPARTSLHEIRKAGRRARDLVQQILAFSRRQDSARGPTCLRAVIEEAHALLRATLPVDVALQLHVGEGSPAVMANATQMEQVMLNLANNALQAAQGRPGAQVQLRLDRADGPPPAVEPGEIEVLPVPGDWPATAARLEVSDNGSGMPPETLARIFEPFFTTKAPGTGTGLGLAVVHGILREHGAVLRVKSRPGEGTRFSIWLPGLEGTEADHASDPHTVMTPSVTRAPNGLRVLYVDDDEAMTLLVRRWLERDGYRVSAFTDVESALQLLRREAEDFHLCISDFNMPGMSGLTLARQVKAIRPDLPMAIASGFISEELRQQAPAAGVDELIYKPDTVEALCEAIDRLIKLAPHGK